MKEKKGSYFYYIKKIMGSLPKKKKKQFPVLLIGMVVIAIFETAVLGLISLFATSLAAPEDILSSTRFLKGVNFLGIDSEISSKTLIITLSVMVVIFMAVKNSVLGFVRYWQSRYSGSIQAYTGQKLLDEYLKVNYQWHLGENAHNLLLILNWRGHTDGFISGALTIMSNLIMVTIMLVGIISFQPVLMPMVVGILGVISLLIYRGIRRMIDSNALKRSKYSRSSTLTSAKTIHGMKDIRIFGLESRFLNEFKGDLFKLVKFDAKQNILTSLPTWLLEVVGFGMLSTSLIIMLEILKLERVEIFGTISLLAVTAWRVLPAINRILGGLSAIRSHFPYLDDLYKAFDDIEVYMRISKKRNATKGVIESREELVFNTSFEFKDLTFKYDSSDRVILDKINCKIEKGQSIGIVGHSGAGKSTFIDLFISLLQPDSGKILVDGRELSQSQAPLWRKKLGYVPQFPYIYDGSLVENIAFGVSLEDIDENKVIEVCKQASIDFLDDLEDGIYTRIGDRGMMISGGQKQRVAIARALYNEPEILVFDEATSSLDTKSEKEIQKTIDSFKGKQTMIVVAHRLSTVENCDYLIWLEQGRLVKMGTPESILKEYIEYQKNSINIEV